MAETKRRLLVAALAASLAFPAQAAGWNGLFDVEARAQALQTPAYGAIRRLCLKIPADRKWVNLKPVIRLATTEGYGSDQAAEDFSWAVMVLSGRALAGDAPARQNLVNLMNAWAKAGAFRDTEEVNDAYYALKRTLLPLTVAYAIVARSLSDAEARTLAGWIDPLVRKVDKLFDGDVDRNNHRVLADSVLAVWGSITGDEAMLAKGLARYDTVMDDVRPDGTLALEARRGARALWYQRQTLSSLVVLAETGRGQGLDLYGHVSAHGQSISTMIGALLNGLASPVLVAVYSAENYIPGPEKDFLNLERGFLEKRGHGRHYMAWSEAAIQAGDDLSFGRLKGLFTRDIVAERPLIDEFAGGNATCFWGEP